MVFEKGVVNPPTSNWAGALATRNRDAYELVERFGHLVVNPCHGSSRGALQQCVRSVSIDVFHNHISFALVFECKVDLGDPRAGAGRIHLLQCAVHVALRPDLTHGDCVIFNVCDRVPFV